MFSLLLHQFVFRRKGKLLQLLYNLIIFSDLIPLLIPNVPFPVCIGIECVEINGNNDCVRIMVRDKKGVVAGVVVQMPVSEIRIE